MPASIPASQLRPQFTQALVGRASDNIVAPGFLQSFFRRVVRPTRYLAIEVSRGTERVAVDVVRGSDGNRNTISRQSLKVIDPPYYDEFFDITEMDHYYALFGGNGNIDTVAYSELLRMSAEKLAMCQAKIERAYELQCAQVLQTGIVTVADGTNINFGRKALSLVDNTANPWSTGTVDPYAQIGVGADFLRQTGKSQGGVINVIMGTSAYAAFINNTIVKGRNNLYHVKLDDITPSQRNSLGGVLHGTMDLGSYTARIWTYNETYENASGVTVPYIDPKKVIVLPDSPDFILGFAAVPQLIDEINPRLVTGEFVYNDFRDPRKKTHEYHVESAGIAIPLRIDQAWTAQVLA